MSTLPPAAVLVFAIIVSKELAGVYGVAIAAVGMLSTLGTRSFRGRLASAPTRALLITYHRRPALCVLPVLIFAGSPPLPLTSSP
jgi:hypothetical protein